MNAFHQDKYASEQVTQKDGGPLVMNAFEMITLSQGLDLSSLFDRQQVIDLLLVGMVDCLLSVQLAQ